MECLQGTKIVKEVKFEGSSVELEAKNCFERQSLIKNVTLTLVFR